MQYRGSGNFKKTVLAKKGNEIKVVNFGHKGYGHNYSSEARSPILHDLPALETKAGGLPRMTNSRQTIGLGEFYGRDLANQRSPLPKDDTLYGKTIKRVIQKLHR